MGAQESQNGGAVLLRPAGVDQDVVLRPVRQVLRHAAEIDEALLERGEVDRIGQDGGGHRSRRELREAVRRAAAVEQIVVLVGETVLARHHPQEIERHVGEAADADGLALEIAPALDGLGGDDAERRVGGGTGDDPDRRAAQDGAQRLIGRGLRDVERAGGELLQHADRGAGHDGVDLQILGLVVFLFVGDVVRQAERGLAGDAEGDFGRRPRRVPARAGQDQQGGGDDCTPSHDFPRILVPTGTVSIQPVAARLGNNFNRGGEH